MIEQSTVLTRGVDSSVAQYHVDWAAFFAAAPDRMFVWAKTMDFSVLHGHYFVDAEYAHTVLGVRGACKKVGPYGFAHTDKDPIEFADFWVATILAHGYSDEDLPPMLDVERSLGSLQGEAVGHWVDAVGERVREKLGRLMCVYTGEGYWSRIGNPKCPQLAKYPLILAAYVENPELYVPPPWHEVGWSVWQETGDLAPRGKKILRVNGVTFDSDVMKGPVEDFIRRSLLSLAATVPAPPPTIPEGPAQPLGWADRAEAEAAEAAKR